MYPAYNKELVGAYGNRVVSVSYERSKIFWVEETRFFFKLQQCPNGGDPILTVYLVYPDGSTVEAEKLVLLIKGLSPCKDTPFGKNGRLSRPITHFRLNTRLAIRNPYKRRRKYLQEQRRVAEAAEIF